MEEYNNELDNNLYIENLTDNIEDEFKTEQINNIDPDINLASSPIKTYISQIKDIRVLTKEENLYYGKIIADNKELFTKKEIDNNILTNIIIGKREEEIIDLEKIFLSINNIQDKEEIFSLLNNYYSELWNETQTDKIIRYYLSEYNKLCKTLNRIPDNNELNNYFNKRNNNYYQIFKNFDSEKKLDNIDEIKHNIKKYVNYMYARNQLIIHNLKLAFSLAKKYCHNFNNNSNFMDIINSANIGLIDAIDKFDYTKDIKFSTYAYYRIKKEIIDYFKKIRHIKVPQDFITDYRKLIKFYDDYIAKNNKKPEIKIIVEALNLDEDRIKELLLYKNNYANILSLNEKVNYEEDEELISFIDNGEQEKIEENLRQEELKKIVAELLLVLDDKEKEIITKRFGLNGEYSQDVSMIAKELGITKEKVRKIETRAMRKIMHPKVLSKIRKTY